MALVNDIAPDRRSAGIATRPIPSWPGLAALVLPDEVSSLRGARTASGEADVGGHTRDRARAAIGLRDDRRARKRTNTTSLRLGAAVLDHVPNCPILIGTLFGRSPERAALLLCEKQQDPLGGPDQRSETLGAWRMWRRALALRVGALLSCSAALSGPRTQG